MRGEESRRTGLYQPGVEVPRAGREDLDQPAARVGQRRPIDQVVGGRDENVGDVEVHPVLPAQRGCDDAVSGHLAEDGPGLGFQIPILPAARPRKGGTVLDPMDHVPGRRDGEPRDVAVPLGVRQHVGAVPRLDETRILDSPGPFEPRLHIPVRVQHRRAGAREAQSIRARGQPEPRRMVADLHVAARVLGAIQHVHLPVSHHGGRIEGGVLLPPYDAVVHGRAECRGGIGREDRVDPLRLLEGPEHPPWSLPARRPHQHRAQQRQPR